LSVLLIDSAHCLQTSENLFRYIFRPLHYILKLPEDDQILVETCRTVICWSDSSINQ